MSTIDRAALIEQAARALILDTCRRDAWDDLSESTRVVERQHMGAALPVIAKALLAHLRELHQPWGDDPGDGCRSGCSAYYSTGRLQRYPCRTAEVLDAIEAEVQP